MEGFALIAEIVGPSGRVHYRRPPDDPLVEQARHTPGYTVRLVEKETIEPDPTWPPLKPEHEWRSEGLAPAKWRADDGTIVYRSYADFCDD